MIFAPDWLSCGCVLMWPLVCAYFLFCSQHIIVIVLWIIVQFLLTESAMFLLCFLLCSMAFFFILFQESCLGCCVFHQWVRTKTSWQKSSFSPKLCHADPNAVHLYTVDFLLCTLLLVLYLSSIVLPNIAYSSGDST